MPNANFSSSFSRAVFAGLTLAGSLASGGVYLRHHPVDLDGSQNAKKAASVPASEGEAQFKMAEVFAGLALVMTAEMAVLGYRRSVSQGTAGKAPSAPTYHFD